MSGVAEAKKAVADRHALVQCPECNADVHEDWEECQNCGENLVADLGVEDVRQKERQALAAREAEVKKREDEALAAQIAETKRREDEALAAQKADLARREDALKAPRGQGG